MGLTLIIIMICTTCLILVFYFFFSKYFPIENNSDGRTLNFDINPAVSVIISSKNAGEQISHLVQKLVQQDYHTFEVIVIDDYSSDGSVDLLYALQNSNLIILKANTDAPGKKIALNQAIAIAKYPILLFTDADCMPQSDVWIKKMVQTLMTSGDKEVVLGYGPMIARGNLLSRFARYETFLTAFQYMAYAGIRLPYMGVGRNLMYKKSLFERTGGFSGHNHIASGDDDLFMKSAATGKNVIVCTDPATFMYSESKDNVYDFLRQKSRHITTSVYYKPVHQLLLGIFSAAHILFYSALIIILLMYHQWITSALLIFFFKLFGQFLLSRKAMKQLAVGDVIIWLPLMDFLLYTYYLILSVYSLFSKNRW